MPDSTATAHIWLDDAGRAWIDDTGYKVSVLAEQHRAWNWDAATLRESHPDLSLAQIQVALAYYYDHREWFELLFNEQREATDTMRLETGDSDLQKRLAELKRRR